MDGADGRVIEGGGRARFTPESFDRTRVARERLGQELQCDLATERQVLGEIDDTHAPAAEQRVDAVVADDVARAHGAPDGIAARGAKNTENAREIERNVI